jgi:hypothetical protein
MLTKGDFFAPMAVSGDQERSGVKIDAMVDTEGRGGLHEVHDFQTVRATMTSRVSASFALGAVKGKVLTGLKNEEGHPEHRQESPTHGIAAVGGTSWKTWKRPRRQN